MFFLLRGSSEFVKFSSVVAKMLQNEPLVTMVLIKPSTSLKSFRTGVIVSRRFRGTVFGFLHDFSTRFIVGIKRAVRHLWSASIVWLSRVTRTFQRGWAGLLRLDPSRVVKISTALRRVKQRWLVFERGFCYSFMFVATAACRSNFSKSAIGRVVPGG
jgi:hypothetical protein